MSEIGFGRRVAKDTRDRRHLMPLREPTVTYKMWSSYGVLDQGATSQCVAYSGFKYLTSGPVINRYPKETPADIYRQCLKVDEWEGEDWEGGTSVRALFRVFTTLGYVTGYAWAFDAQRVVGHVIEAGPVVVGTSWLRDMNFPDDETGYISASGRNDGGHAWLIIGASLKKKNPDGSVGAVRMMNSWGQGWGQNGRAWVTINDLDKLIKDDGEACVASEIKISALGLEMPSFSVAVA